MSSQELAQCPYCAQPVGRDAEVCAACNSRLKPIAEPPRPESTQPAAPEVTTAAAEASGAPVAPAAPAGEQYTAASGTSGMMMAAGVSLLLILIIGAIGAKFLVPLASKAKDATVRDNMVVIQKTADTFGTAHGHFPLTVDDFRSSFSASSAGQGGGTPVNPFDNQAEMPIVGSTRDLTALKSETTSSLKPGQIEYIPLLGSDGTVGKSYAIRAADGTGQFVQSKDGGLYILSH